jgi:hypothetical protein
MKSLFLAAILALSASAIAADKPTPEVRPRPAVDQIKFDWHDVIDMTKDEAVKAATAAGWKVVVVDTWLMKVEPSKERTLYLCVNKDGKVTGVLVSPAE